MYKKVINLTFLPIFENKEAIMMAMSIPLLLIILFNHLMTLYPDELAVTIGSSLVLVSINIIIAITTHRILLLGSNSVPKWGAFAFGKREFSFLLTSIGLGIICIPVVLVGFIPVVGIFIAPIGVIIIITRLSLVFPAIAIDEKLSFKQAWNFTKNYKLLVFFTIIIFPLIFALIIGGVYGLVIEFLAKVVWAELEVLYPVLDVFTTVFMVSALSATFRFIAEEHPEFFDPSQEETLPENEVKIINNNKEFIVDTNEVAVNFDLLKEELISQYEALGFNHIVLNKESSWMAKDPNNTQAYISLSMRGTTYVIESYNIQEANLDKFIKKEETLPKEEEKDVPLIEQ